MCVRPKGKIPLNSVYYTYILLTLYPQRGNKAISDISPRRPRFTKKAMRNTAVMTGGKPIAIWSQSISVMTVIGYE
jgi:hypothetical protein